MKQFDSALTSIFKHFFSFVSSSPDVVIVFYMLRYLYPYAFYCILFLLVCIYLKFFPQVLRSCLIVALEEATRGVLFCKFRKILGKTPVFETPEFLF